MENISVKFKGDKLIITIDTSVEGTLAQSKRAKILAKSGQGFTSIKNDENDEEYGLNLVLTQRVLKEPPAKTKKKAEVEDDGDEKPSKKKVKNKVKKRK